MSLITKVADLAIAIATDIKSLSSTVSLFDDRVTALESADPGGAAGADGVFDSVKVGALSPKFAYALIESDAIGTITPGSSNTLYKAMTIPASIPPADIISVSFSIKRDNLTIAPQSGLWSRISSNATAHYYRVDSSYQPNKFVIVFDEYASVSLVGGIIRMFITYKIA